MRLKRFLGSASTDFHFEQKISRMASCIFFLFLFLKPIGLGVETPLLTVFQPIFNH